MKLKNLTFKYKESFAGIGAGLAALSLSLGCQGRKTEENTGRPETPPPSQKSDDLGNNKKDGKIFEVKEASAVLAFTEDEIKKAVPQENLTLAKLEYKVTYGDVIIGPEPLSFKNGKAIVKIDDLPANKSGEFKLEILSGDKPKLEAKMSNIVLPSDKISTVEVTLKAVAEPGSGAPGGTAPGGTAPGGTAPGGTVPGGAGSAGPSAWDGKSDKGNKTWKIIPAK
jgi:hypothetical protein